LNPREGTSWEPPPSGEKEATANCREARPEWPFGEHLHTQNTTFHYAEVYFHLSWSHLVKLDRVASFEQPSTSPTLI
jgi:hypothetical protein